MELFPNNKLNELYKEFCQWRNQHPYSYYITYEPRVSNIDGRTYNRYFVHKGIEMYRFFGDVVISTISGDKQLHQPICCSSQDEATKLAAQLNVRYVHDHEPDTYAQYPSWQEAFQKYYPNEVQILTQ